MYRSTYIEYSFDNKPFKHYTEYNIDWEKITEIAKSCGMISVSEEINSGQRKKITLWSRETSYTEWLSNPYVKEYITQRDTYNKQNNIITELVFEKYHEN